MMPCPFCTEGRTIVIDSQWDDPNKTIRRDRHCLACRYQWTTLEVDLDQINNLLKLKNDKNDSIDHPTDGFPP